MQIEKYQTESAINKLVFSFKSIGTKIIEKKVLL
jgi:hypothetical protein